MRFLELKMLDACPQMKSFHFLNKNMFFFRAYEDQGILMTGTQSASFHN
jgi:hypothetical protein